MDVAYNRHSRRSTTNLNHLSLAPLTPKFPIGDEYDLPDSDQPQSTHVSYISGKSAPTTPGILSRNTSTTRLPRPHNRHLASRLPKSKSSSHLLARRHGGSHKPSLLPPASSSDFLLRAGAAISSSTAESKGQSWLTTRASSISLVSHPNQSDDTILSPGPRRDSTSFADDEFCASPLSTRSSRYNSRRGSREAAITPLTRSGAQTPRHDRSSAVSGFFDGATHEGEEMMEPDFVDGDEEQIEAVGSGEDNDEEEEDREMRGLTRGGRGWLGFGFGLFGGAEGEGSDVEGDDEDVDGEEEDTPEKDSEGRQPQRNEGIRVGDLGVRPVNEGDEGEGGWADAAYLLSVASRILL